MRNRCDEGGIRRCRRYVYGYGACWTMRPCNPSEVIRFRGAGILDFRYLDFFLFLNISNILAHLTLECFAYSTLFYVLFT